MGRHGASRLSVVGLKRGLTSRRSQSVRQTMLARDGDSLTLRMLVPVPLCGCIIGKGGAVIRSIMDDSKAQIAVSSQVPEQQPELQRHSLCTPC